MVAKYRQEYPKVLIVNGEPINSLTATGLTLRNLFHNWPTECVAQIHTQTMPCEGNCSFSRRVTVMDLGLPASLKKYILRQTNEFKGSQISQGLPTAESTKIPKKNRKVFLKNIRGDIYTLLNLAPFKLHLDLYDSCNRFKPDIIYSMLGSIEIMKLAHHLSVRLKVPVVPHFMDDWPSTQSRTFPFAPLFLPVQTWLLHKIVHKAPLVLSICDAMSKEYERRYEKELHAFMNCVDTSKRPVYTANSNCNNRVHLAYVGSFHSKRSVQLREIATGLIALEKIGIKGEVVIYAQGQAKSHDDNLIIPPVMRWATTEESALIETKDSPIDAFIHVDSFNSSAIKFFNYSMSGKLPWCMAAGVPLFAYGPPEISTMQYILQNDIGLVVMDRSFDCLYESLKSFLVNSELRKKLGRRAREIAIEHHESTVQGERLKSVLARAVALGLEGK